jgi:hypothetical protein
MKWSEVIVKNLVKENILYENFQVFDFGSLNNFKIICVTFTINGIFYQITKVLDMDKFYINILDNYRFNLKGILKVVKEHSKNKLNLEEVERIKIGRSIADIINSRQSIPRYNSVITRIID